MRRLATTQEWLAEGAVARSTSALGAFEGSLRMLTDPRRAKGRRYPLRSVVLFALMAMICGSDDAEAGATLTLMS